MKLHFPKPFKHRHPPVESTNELFEAQLTKSQRAADWFAALMGSKKSAQSWNITRPKTRPSQLFMRN